MADGPPEPAGAPGGLAVAVPAPPNGLAELVAQVTWPKGRAFHRIHSDAYGAAQFNTSPQGNARFSPLWTADGRPIATLYGGNSFDCAALETVFHDVPFGPGLKTFDKSKLAGKVHSRLVPRRDLLLADLTGPAQRRLGIRRNQLIDTEKDLYPGTRAWARAIHGACPGLDGLYWVSRQDDRARALMLFGDRVAAGDLSPQGESCAVLDARLYPDLLDLAARIGVLVVDGM